MNHFQVIFYNFFQQDYLVMRLFGPIQLIFFYLGGPAWVFQRNRTLMELIKLPLTSAIKVTGTNASSRA